MHAVLSLTVLEETQHVRRRTALGGRYPGLAQNTTAAAASLTGAKEKAGADTEPQPLNATSGDAVEGSVTGLEDSKANSTSVPLGGGARATERKRRRKQISRRQKNQPVTNIQSLV